MSETKLKKETVKKQNVKKVIKSEDIITLDENKNIIKKTIQTVDKELSINDNIELKIDNNFDAINNEVLNVINEIGDANDIIEIEADVLEDEIIENNKNEIEIEIEENNEQIKSEELLEPIINEPIKQPTEEILDNEYKKEKDEILLLSNTVDYNQYNLITEPYEYKHEDNIKIIKDKPSVPLIPESFINNKDYYNNFLNKSFELYRNGQKVYDSDYSSVKIIFEEKYFLLYGQMYNYQGIRIKIK